MVAAMSLFRRNFYPMVKPKGKWTFMETDAPILRIHAGHSQKVWDISAKDPIPPKWLHTLASSQENHENYSIPLQQAPN